MLASCTDAGGADEVQINPPPTTESAVLFLYFNDATVLGTLTIEGVADPVTECSQGPVSVVEDQSDLARLVVRLPDPAGDGSLSCTIVRDGALLLKFDVVIPKEPIAPRCEEAQPQLCEETAVDLDSIQASTEGQLDFKVWSLTR